MNPLNFHLTAICNKCEMPDQCECTAGGCTSGNVVHFLDKQGKQYVNPCYFSEEDDSDGSYDSKNNDAAFPRKMRTLEIEGKVQRVAESNEHASLLTLKNEITAFCAAPQTGRQDLVKQLLMPTPLLPPPLLHIIVDYVCHVPCRTSTQAGCPNAADFLYLCVNMDVVHVQGVCQVCVSSVQKSRLCWCDEYQAATVVEIVDRAFNQQAFV
jgi:hypothetical protein